MENRVITDYLDILFPSDSNNPIKTSSTKSLTVTIPNGHKIEVPIEEISLIVEKELEPIQTHFKKEDIIQVQNLEEQDGSIYSGSLLNGKKHGQGEFIYPNGEKYIGEWNNGQRNGKGTYRYYDGSNFSGEWKNDQKEKGIYSSSDGTKICEISDNQDPIQKQLMILAEKLIQINSDLEESKFKSKLAEETLKLEISRLSLEKLEQEKRELKLQIQMDAIQLKRENNIDLSLYILKTELDQILKALEEKKNQEIHQIKKELEEKLQKKEQELLTLQNRMNSLKKSHEKEMKELKNQFEKTEKEKKKGFDDLMKNFQSLKQELKEQKNKDHQAFKLESENRQKEYIQSLEFYSQENMNLKSELSLLQTRMTQITLSNKRLIGEGFEELSFDQLNEMETTYLQLLQKIHQFKEKRLKEILSEKEDSSLCKICFDKRIETVILNCGHSVLCLDCSKKLKKECPFCSQPIKKIIKIFSS